MVVRRRHLDVELELTGGAPTDDPSSAAIAPLAAAVTDRAAAEEAAGATVHLAADHPAESDDAVADAVADAAGFPRRRDLLQLRRPLPVPADHPARADAPALEIRPFRDGPDHHDADAWIRANNRAFAGHPDQGHETRATVAARTAEPWFDPDDLLLADDPARPGELAGACWTKRHPATAEDPALGEIYVISVDPSHRGERLGPALVLAGLDHLASIGLGTAVLYVDLANASARRLYDDLGFVLHRRRRVYER